MKFESEVDIALNPDQMKTVIEVLEGQLEITKYWKDKVKDLESRFEEHIKIDIDRYNRLVSRMEALKDRLETAEERLKL